MSNQGKINIGLFAMLAMLFAFAIMLVLSIGPPQEEPQSLVTNALIKKGLKSTNKHMFQLAHLEGNPDSTQATGNYSGADSVKFVFVAPPGDYISVERMIVGISDALIDNSDEYGAINALPVGINIDLHDTDSSVIETYTPRKIKTNGQWAFACHDLTYHNSVANGNDFITARWTFSRSGYPIIMKPGQYLAIDLNDDFTGLLEHQFFIQGYYLDEAY